MPTVLVVDDYEPFRRLVSSMLQQGGCLQVIGEASDGLEALQKAEEMQPDLILLDVGMPKLNGIEAARGLRQVVPRAKILFLSEEPSSEVVGEALKLGAMGYVHKVHTRSELLPAIEAVLEGKQFVGTGLKAEFGGSEAVPVPCHHHEMLIYSEEATLLEAFTRFIGTAMRADNPVIAVATKSHLDSLFQRLNAEGLNVDAAIERRAFIPLDALKKLSALMVNDLPNEVRCRNAMSGLVNAVRVAKGEHRIAFCGECPPLLLVQGNAEAAIRLEQLSNNFAKAHKLDMLCAYPSSSFLGGQGEGAFKSICAEHSVIIPR